MYYETVKEWADELIKDQKLKDIAKETLNKKILECEKLLEKIFMQEVAKQLEPINKVAEFERIVLFDSQYTNKYLNQTIPGFYNFRMEVFNKAKDAIINKLLELTI